MAKKRPHSDPLPTLDDCKEAMDFLDDEDNFENPDDADELRVRVQDYPDGSGKFYLALIWFGENKPAPRRIPMPPGWWMDEKWFLTEARRGGRIVKVWGIALLYRGRRS